MTDETNTTTKITVQQAKERILEPYASDSQVVVEERMANSELSPDKMTLNFLLDLSCSNPEDFRQYEKWTRENGEKLERGEKPEYTYYGWSRFEIVLHCRRVVIVARKAKNGGYHIKNWVVLDH